MAGLRIVLAACTMALPLWVAQLTPVHACTYSLHDSIRDAETIAVGTMGDMAVLSADAVEHPEALGDRTPVQIAFSVDEYLKGSGPNPLQLYQPAAQISYDGGQIIGILTSGTSCGALISTGDRYVVLLQQSGYEMLAGSSKLGSDDENNFILDEIAKVLSEPGALPVVGTGPGLQHADSPAAQLPLVLLAVGGVTLASGALLLGRRLR